MVFPIMLLLLTFCLIKVLDGGITDKWDLCGCVWMDWQSWGTCDSECNGRRTRERKVWLYTEKDGCPFKFTTCASDDMGSDYSRCNTFCYNGGTSDSYKCSCVTGFFGTCCNSQVNCGYPGTVTFGQIHGSSYTYGSTVTYSCNSGYILVGGATVRTCQINRLWSGTTPRCAFYSSCRSHPCRNGAMCNNLPDDYKCICRNGWSGRHCEIDIQPPVMDNCGGNIYAQTSDLTKTIEWKIPKFTDPHNNGVEISSNYPKNSWTFPWGDFTVSYLAVKPNNGLSVECIFQIQVRPHTCYSLAKPIQGVVICNNWRTDYGKFCIQMCQESFTVPRGVDPFKWYVCGASGSWIPVSSASNCTVDEKTLHSMGDYNIADSYKTCEEDTSRMQSYFINRLKRSPFKYFCDKFPAECLDENVSVRC